MLKNHFLCFLLLWNFTFTTSILKPWYCRNFLLEKENDSKVNYTL